MRKLTDEEFRDRVLNLVGDQYIPITSYVNRRTKVLMFHKDCCQFYWVNPDSFINGGRRCRYCYGNLGKTTGVFKKEIKTLYGDEYKVLGTYNGANKPIEVLHTVCNHKFYPTPESLKHGHTCKYCSYIKRAKNKARTMFIKNKLSSGEKMTKVVLNKLGYNYTFGYVLSNKLHLDFYLPKHKIGIEYDGIQHYQPRELFGGLSRFKEVKRHDKIKNQYCIEHGIKLIRIPYTVDTSEKILSYLKKNGL